MELWDDQPMRVIDSRDELRRQIPEACPECGGAIHIEEVTSRSWERQPIEYARGAITQALPPPEPVRTEWRSLDWWCVVDREHWVDAPVALGY
jgi:hypothetical protein